MSSSRVFARGSDFTMPLGDLWRGGRTRVARIYGRDPEGVEVQADGPFSSAEAWVFGWQLMAIARERGYVRADDPWAQKKQTDEVWRG